MNAAQLNVLLDDLYLDSQAPWLVCEDALLDAGRDVDALMIALARHWIWSKDRLIPAIGRLPKFDPDLVMATQRIKPSGQGRAYIRRRLEKYLDEDVVAVYDPMKYLHKGPHLGKMHYWECGGLKVVVYAHGWAHRFGLPANLADRESPVCYSDCILDEEATQ